MPKEPRISLRLSLPEGHAVDKVTLESGTVRMYDRSGNEVLPIEVERTTEYDRVKGPKVQARFGASVAAPSVGYMELLSRLDHFFAIDANTADVHGIKMTAAFFIACKLRSHPDGYELQSLDGRGYVYEFHDVPGNPEFFAIRRVANDVLATHPLSPGASVAFITDSDLAKHDQINNRILPLYGSDYLHDQFKLLYASADTGTELINRLIRFCDRQAAAYIKRSRKQGVSLAGLRASPESPTISYRCTVYPSLSIVNPVVKDAAVTDATTVSLKVS